MNYSSLTYKSKGKDKLYKASSFEREDSSNDFQAAASPVKRVLYKPPPDMLKNVVELNRIFTPPFTGPSAIMERIRPIQSTNEYNNGHNNGYNFHYNNGYNNSNNGFNEHYNGHNEDNNGHKNENEYSTQNQIPLVNNFDSSDEDETIIIGKTTSSNNSGKVEYFYDCGENEDGLTDTGSVYYKPQTTQNKSDRLNILTWKLKSKSSTSLNTSMEENSQLSYHLGPLERIKKTLRGEVKLKKSQNNISNGLSFSSPSLPLDPLPFSPPSPTSQILERNYLSARVHKSSENGSSNKVTNSCTSYYNNGSESENENKTNHSILTINHDKSFNCTTTRVSFANEFIASQMVSDNSPVVIGNSTMDKVIEPIVEVEREDDDKESDEESDKENDKEINIDSLNEDINGNGNGNGYGNGNGNGIGNGKKNKEMISVGDEYEETTEYTKKVESENVIQTIDQPECLSDIGQEIDNEKESLQMNHSEIVTPMAIEINNNINNGQAISDISAVSNHHDKSSIHYQTSESKFDPINKSYTLQNAFAISQEHNQVFKSLPYSQVSPLRQPFPGNNSLPIPPNISTEVDQNHIYYNDNSPLISTRSGYKPISPRLIVQPLVPLIEQSTTKNIPIHPIPKTPSPVMPSYLRNRLSLLDRRQSFNEESSDDEPASSEMEHFEKKVHNQLSVDEEFAVNLLNAETPPQPVPEQVTSAQYREAKSNGKSSWGPKLIDGFNSIPRGVSQFISSSSPSSKINDNSPVNSSKTPVFGDIFSSMKIKKTQSNEVHGEENLEETNSNKWVISNSNRAENTSQNTMYSIIRKQNSEDNTIPSNSSTNVYGRPSDGISPNGNNIIPTSSGSSVYGGPSDSNYKESTSIESTSIDERMDDNKKEQPFMEGIQGIIDEVMVDQKSKQNYHANTINGDSTPVTHEENKLSGLFDVGTYPRSNPLASFTSIKRNHQSLFDYPDKQDSTSAPILSDKSNSSGGSDLKKSILHRKQIISIKVREKFRRAFELTLPRSNDRRDENSPSSNENSSSSGLRTVGLNAYKRLSRSAFLKNTREDKTPDIDSENSPMSTQTILEEAGASEPKVGREESRMSVRKTIINKFRFHKENDNLSNGV